jgi:hypothetical protein
MINLLDALLTEKISIIMTGQKYYSKQSSTLVLNMGKGQ